MPYFDFENKHKIYNLGVRVALSFSYSNDESCLPSIWSHSHTTYSFTCSSDTSLRSVESLGAASSPKPTVVKPNSNRKKPLRTPVINFQSLRKRARALTY